MADFDLGPIVDKVTDAASEVFSDIVSAGQGALSSLGFNAGNDLAGNSFDSEGPIYKEAGPTDGGKNLISIQNLWKVEPEAWYKVFPYQFVVTITSNGKAEDKFFYTLPIPPQALITKMIPASQATATVGGVVEETSANTFWAVNLIGTTGIAIGRSSGDQTARKKVADKFRERLQTTGLLAGTFSNLGGVVNKVAGTADAVLNGLASGSVSGVINGVSGAIQNALLPVSPFAGSAVNKKTNGFAEIQQLHRFLLVYSRLKGSYPSTYNLEFRNWKTRQKWKCVIQDFTIQQNATNPHLYRYNIQLKCWDVADVNGGKKNETGLDRFGPDGDLSSVNTLSAQGVLTGLANIGTNLSNTSGYLGTVFK